MKKCWLVFGIRVDCYDISTGHKELCYICDDVDSAIDKGEYLLSIDEITGYRYSGYTIDEEDASMFNEETRNRYI